MTTIINRITPTRVEKTWGYELWFANNQSNDYCGKLLHINKDQKFSMHFHLDKHETFYVSKGKVILRVVDLNTGTLETTTLHTGDAVEIPRMLPHQIQADEDDAEIIEASTFHRDVDSYRVWR